MDTEKETQTPETKSIDNIPNDDKLQENTDTLPTKDQTDQNPSPPDDSESKESEIVQEQPTDDGAKAEIQEEAEPEEAKIEDSSPLPPDLEKVSEEIDQFISDLSHLKGNDEDSKPPDVPVSVEQFTVLVDAKIDDYDGGDAPIKWSQLSQEDATSFLEIVDRMTKLSVSLCRFSSEYKYAYPISRIGGVLQRALSAWIITFKHCTNVLFSNERKLVDAVFADQPSLAETIFSNLCRGMMIQLLNFAEAVAMTKRAAEKLFKFLDIYETLRDLLPLVDKMFHDTYADELKAEATLTRSRLGESMVSIFSELESSIQSDSNRTPVPGGAVHPLTRYIMNYLKYVAEYRDTLEQVFREHQMVERADSTSGADFDPQNPQAQNYNVTETSKLSPFEMHMMKVMDLLDANLESKSRLYRDTSLSSIFMMNNGRYILQKIKGSPEINSLVGDQWYRKRSSDLRQYHKNYQRETWGKLLQCLNHEGLNVNGKVNKPILKERFKSFNALFDEIHKTQSSWVISDEQLQSELRVSISNMVIPAYRSFLGRFSQTFTPGRQTEKYVKYQPEDIETHIDELFDGNAAPWGRKKL